MRRRRTTLIAALAVFLPTLLLSGCEKSKKLKSSLDPVAVAAEKTTSSKTVHFSMTATEQIPGLAAPITITGEGAMSFADRRVSMQMDMSAMATMTGGRLGSPSDWKIEAVMDGLVMYMRMPFLQTALGIEKPWLKIDLESVGKQAGLDVSTFTTYNPGSFTQGIDYLRGSKNARVVGHESIDGVETTHYQANIDLDLYLERLPSDQRSAAKKALEALEEQGHPEYGPFDIWIDNDNRVRRESFSFSMTAAGTSQPLEMNFEMNLYDYDKPVEIVIPPSDQTVDFAEITRSLSAT